GGQGDPEMAFESPVEQWRTRYRFVTPVTYVSSFVNIVAPRGSHIQLDGGTLAGARAVFPSHDVYRVDLSASPGAHQVLSLEGVPFGLKVYGFAPYTSYMYPGGLDLARTQQRDQ